jgi:dipeptidyl-peptidase-4
VVRHEATYGPNGADDFRSRLRLSSHQLKKLGGDNPPSTTMFAAFSPGGKRVASVHRNNLYVQDLLDFRITPLTRNGSDTLINGTSDAASL